MKAQYARRIKDLVHWHGAESMPEWIEQRYNEAYMVLRSNMHAHEQEV